MNTRYLIVGAMILLNESVVQAQIVNGDFDAGGDGWSVSAPPGWSITFNPAGGNPGGFVRIESPASHSGGTACIRQTFFCGPATPDSVTGCSVAYGFRFEQLAGAIENGRIFWRVDDCSDGEGTFFPIFDWQQAAVNDCLCGTRTLELCLNVEPGDNHFAISFDNIASTTECDVVGAEVRPWGLVKSRYR